MDREDIVKCIAWSCSAIYIVAKVKYSYDKQDIGKEKKTHIPLQKIILHYQLLKLYSTTMYKK